MKRKNMCVGTNFSCDLQIWDQFKDPASPISTYTLLQGAVEADWSGFLQGKTELALESKAKLRKKQHTCKD